jgi:hypothetical protein
MMALCLSALFVPGSMSLFVECVSIYGKQSLRITLFL